MDRVSIIIPTHNRPEWLQRAVASALAQDGLDAIEVIVVDDGSNPPATVVDDPRVVLLRQEPARGGSAARNAGLERASGRWIFYLDDDDELLPGALRRGLDAVAASDLPPPVAALTAVEVVDASGRVVELRYPPTLPRGSLWNLEPVAADRSFNVKQSLLAERQVLQSIGGFDESFRSRVHSDLFLRLNPVCSLAGVDAPGYRLYRHEGAKVSTNKTLRRTSFVMLLDKHRAVFEGRPRAYAQMLLGHVRMCRREGMKGEALRWLVRAARYDPGAAASFAWRITLRSVGLGKRSETAEEPAV